MIPKFLRLVWMVSALFALAWTRWAFAASDPEVPLVAAVLWLQTTLAFVGTAVVGRLDILVGFAPGPKSQSKDIGPE